MESITRTVYGSYIQTCLLLGIAPEYPANTTLNEKFNINASIRPTQDDRPHLGYYAVGLRGHQIKVGTNGIPKPENVPHQATDAALYGHLPFVLRPIDNDLTSVQRQRYALRREESHNNQRYIAYYLKRIDLRNVIPAMLLKVVSNGQTQTSPFVPNTSNLNPTPPDIADTGVNLVDGSYVAASARVSLEFTEDDATELLNAAKVLYDDEGYAIISEIALCTGVDKVVQITSPNGNFNMNEAIGVQITSHIPAMYALKFNNTGVGINLDVGATEPLFRLN
jgi:hypothetical protein